MRPWAVAPGTVLPSFCSARTAAKRPTLNRAATTTPAVARAPQPLLLPVIAHLAWPQVHTLFGSGFSGTPSFCFTASQIRSAMQSCPFLFGLIPISLVVWVATKRIPLLAGVRYGKGDLVPFFPSD